MTTNATCRQESTARVRPATIVLGTDAEGATHLYRTQTETVHVVDADGRREHVASVAGRPVEDWMAHVRDARGWASEHYGLDFVGHLAARLDG